MQLILDAWAEAGRALEEQRRRHPRFADIRNLSGLLHLAQGDPAAAVAEFEAALEVNPGYRRARFSLLLAMRLRDGDLDPGLWNRTNPADGAVEPERSLWTAWFLSQSGDKTGTRAVLERLAQTPEWSAIGSYALAVHEWGWGEPQRARAALRLIAVAPSAIRTILEARGVLRRRRGGKSLEPAGGPGVIEAGGTEWNPCASDLYEYLGMTCGRHGRIDEALAMYEEAFLRHGQESQHQIQLSQLALARGDEEEAVRALRLAIEIDPTSVAARIALGYEYQSQGFQEEALVQFEVATRLRPSYPDVLYNLGLLYEAKGRSADAVRCLHRALEVNPAYFQARTTLAQVLIREESWTEALEELGRLRDQGIRSADLFVQRAQACLALGDAQAAVVELEQAVALNPSFARTYYTLGQVYRQLGLKRKARSAWKQYLERSRSWREMQPAEEGEVVSR